MSFLAPFMLGAGAIAAAAVFALHLLTTRRPPMSVLPTARFVPISDASAVSRSTRPSDLALLACRVLAVLLLAAAFARPVLDAPGPAVRAVVMLDVSSNVADAAAAERLAREKLTDGGAVVLFDSTAREVEPSSLGATPAGADSSSTSARRAAPRAAPRAAHGILSAALVSATRAARRVARGADSVRLVLVSPMSEEQGDAATDAIRAAWPGGITVVQVAAVSDTARGATVRLVSPLADDPLAPAIARLAAARGTADVRIVREGPSAADSAWVRTNGHVLVHWPLAGDGAPVADGVTAFGLRTATVVAPLVRMSGRSQDTASTTGTARAARVIARWRDGAAAAYETPIDDGCVRDVGVGIPLAGDLTLRPPFDGFLSVLVEPCGGARGLPLSAESVTRFSGGEQAASAARLTADANADGRIALLLLALALTALAVEWVLRRRRNA